MKASACNTGVWLSPRCVQVTRTDFRWRQNADGQLEKNPFPAEKTSVNVVGLSAGDVEQD